MASLAKEARLRNEGMDMALRVVLESGVEGLKEEVRNRGAYGTSVNIPNRVLKEASAEMLERSSMIAVSAAVLVMKEHFYFNESQINDFKSSYWALLECIADNKELTDDMIERAGVCFTKGGVQI